MATMSIAPTVGVAGTFQPVKGAEALNSCEVRAMSLEGGGLLVETGRESLHGNYQRVAAAAAAAATERRIVCPKGHPRLDQDEPLNQRAAALVEAAHRSPNPSRRRLAVPSLPDHDLLTALDDPDSAVVGLALAENRRREALYARAEPDVCVCGLDPAASFPAQPTAGTVRVVVGRDLAFGGERTYEWYLYQEVAATLCGSLAVHPTIAKKGEPPPAGWSVTHRWSGLRLGDFRCSADVTRFLSDAGGHPAYQLTSHQLQSTPAGRRLAGLVELLAATPRKQQRRCGDCRRTILAGADCPYCAWEQQGQVTDQPS